MVLCTMKHSEKWAGRSQWKQRAIIKPFTRQLPAQQQGNEQGSAEELTLRGALHLPLPMRQNKGLPKIQQGRASSQYLTQCRKAASPSLTASRPTCTTKLTLKQCCLLDESMSVLRQLKILKLKSFIQPFIQPSLLCVTFLRYPIGHTVSCFGNECKKLVI